MGIVIVYTGNGKGKTTAALGIVLRAVAYNYKVCMVQFIKGSWIYGEMISWERLKPEFELIVGGKGFVGIIDDNKPIDEHKMAALNALTISKEKVSSGKYDIVILDEINYAINLGLIDINDVIDLINKRAYNTTLILTGNYARREILELADLVTEMREVKHPYKKGIKAIKGIDY